MEEKNQSTTEGYDASQDEAAKFKIDPATGEIIPLEEGEAWLDGVSDGFESGQPPVFAQTTATDVIMHEAPEKPASNQTQAEDVQAKPVTEQASSTTSDDAVAEAINATAEAVGKEDEEIDENYQKDLFFTSQMPRLDNDVAAKPKAATAKAVANSGDKKKLLVVGAVGTIALAATTFMAMQLFGGNDAAKAQQKTEFKDINVPAKPIPDTMNGLPASAPASAASMPEAGSSVVPPVATLPASSAGPLPAGMTAQQVASAAATPVVPASSVVAMPAVAASQPVQVASTALAPNTPAVVPPVATSPTGMNAQTTTPSNATQPKAAKAKQPRKAQRKVVRAKPNVAKKATSNANRDTASRSMREQTALSEMRLVSIFPKTGPNKQAWVRLPGGSIAVVRVGDSIGGGRVRFIDGDSLVVQTTNGSIR